MLYTCIKLCNFLNVFISETTWAIFTISFGAFCWKGIDNCLNGSVPLNKMASMPIYGKNTYKSFPEPRKFWSWILVYSFKDSGSTKSGGGGRGWGRVWWRCCVRHQGVHLILAYSWVRLAILVAGQGKGDFLFLLFFPFISVPLYSLSPSFISSTIFYLFSPFLWEITQNDPQGLTCC